VRQQRLLDGNDFFPIAVCVLKRPELNIGLDIARGKIHHGLVKVVLDTLSANVLETYSRRWSQTDRPPEIVHHEGPPVDAARILSRPLGNQVREELRLGRLEQRHDLEMAFDVIRPTSPDKARALGDFLGRKGTKGM
jgi:hypothetical protein